MKPRLMLAALLSTVLLAACATSPTQSGTGTNPVESEGQTLGGYVATGAVDPENAEGTRTGDDDQTPTGTPEETEPTTEPPPPPRI